VASSGEHEINSAAPLSWIFFLNQLRDSVPRRSLVTIKPSQLDYFRSY